jgi:hypothetical protein
MRTEFGESIDVGHLLRSSIIFKDLKVLIMTDSSLMWSLACVQVGVGDISLSPISETAKKNYSCLCREKLSLLDNVHTIEWLTPVSRDDYDLLLVEVSNTTMIKDIPWDAAPRMIMLGPRGCLRATTDTTESRPGSAKHLTDNLGGSRRQRPFYAGEVMEVNGFG